MTYRDQQSALRALYDTANAQGGYVTAKQAAAAGFARQHLAYHVAVGNLERVERGLFRLPTIPVTEHDDLIRWTLWSRGRDDDPQAVVSHVTAMRVHDLSDMLPGEIHLTVPPGFRKRSPRGCVLHRATLKRSESTARTGFRVTTALRTLLDVAREVEIPTDQIRLAMHEAVDRGMVTKAALRTVIAKDDSSSRLIRAMGDVL